METSQNKPKNMSAGNVQVKLKKKGYRKRNVFWLFAAKIEYKSLGIDEESLREEKARQQPDKYIISNCLALLFSPLKRAQLTHLQQIAQLCCCSNPLRTLCLANPITTNDLKRDGDSVLRKRKSSESAKIKESCLLHRSRTSLLLSRCKKSASNKHVFVVVRINSGDTVKLMCKNETKSVSVLGTQKGDDHCNWSKWERACWQTFVILSCRACGKRAHAFAATLRLKYAAANLNGKVQLGCVKLLLLLCTPWIEKDNKVNLFVKY